MPLSSGTKLGSYEIVQSIGAGGMGEVYKATDTRLGRQVAIKILPAQFSGQEEFKQRFEREAQTIAGLTHPHICTLYDVGRQDGTNFLVMELLEGETLGARIASGPLPVEEALRVAIQVSDALDKAHTLGVTHRDLKPTNIMLTKSGAKLMDFGLAKRRSTLEGGSPSIMPTKAAELTQQGSIIGTVQYMAPEQIEGEEADPRTDIFALGVVIYEMITGKKAFAGKSQASLMASILHHQPEPMSTVQALTPPALQRVVEICMAKDPRDRWQTAHDVMLQVRWIAEGGSSVGLPQPVAHHRKHREWLAWGIAALGLVAAAALAFPYVRKATPDVRVMRFSVFPNAGTAFGPENAGIRPFPAISPDGKRIVFQAQEPNEPVYLWVRSLDALDAQRLQGTEGAAIPFWSPDGQHIAFTADNKLKRVDATGGAVQVLCDVTSNTSAEGTWGPGVILFSNAPGTQDTRTNTGILRVPENGGTPTVVIAPSKDRKESLLRAPYFLPDGKHFVYLAQEPNVINVASLDPSEPPKKLLAAESRAVVAPEGYLLFVQQGNLMAQTFDLTNLVLSGNAFPVAESVRTNVGNGRSAFSISNNGTLVYRTGAVRGGEGLQAAWFDREGKPTGIPGQQGDNRYPRISPDGKQIVVERRPASDITCKNCTDLWTIDLLRGTNTRLTFGKGDARVGGWSADGASILYASNPESAFALFTKLATGVGNEELLLKSDLNITAITDVSRDYLLFMVNDANTGNDIWVLPLTGTRAPKPFVNTPFNQGQAHFSADGHWIAYVSNESGQNQIYIQPFPANGQRILVSVDGGAQPRWRGDGKELFFAGARRLLMSVEIKASASTVEAGKPARLFLLPDGGSNSYDVTRDGQRFLIAAPPNIAASGANTTDNNVPLTVVTNWTAAVKPAGLK